MQSVTIMWCFICKVSVLFTATFAMQFRFTRTVIRVAQNTSQTGAWDAFRNETHNTRKLKKKFVFGIPNDGVVDFDFVSCFLHGPLFSRVLMLCSSYNRVGIKGRDEKIRKQPSGDPSSGEIP